MEPVKAVPVRQAFPKQRNHGLDLLRILSISGVVAIHVFGLRVGAEPKGDRSWWLAAALDIGFIWVVPVFIMISGALLLGSSQLHADPAGFYRKRGLRIIPALMAWNFIYLVGVRIWMRDEVLSAGRILQLLYDSSVFTQLYFLWIIVGLYAIAPLLATFLRQGGPNRAAVLAGVLVSAAVLAYMLPGVLAQFNVSRPVSLNFLTLWIPYVGYFVAGYALRNVRLKGLPLTALSALVVGLAAFTIWHYGNRGVLPRVDIFVNENYFGVLVAAMSLGVFVVALSLAEGLKLPPKTATATVALSDASFGVFLFHFVVLEAIRLNFAAVSTDHALPALAATYLVTLAASFLVSLIGLRIPGLRRIF